MPFVQSHRSLVEPAGKEGEQEGLEDEEEIAVVKRSRCQLYFYCAGVYRYLVHPTYDLADRQDR